MKVFRNILSLSSVSVTLCLLSAIALCFVSCKTNTIPLDDAYHWPDKKASVEASSPAQSANSETPESPSPAVEYLNVQDTTVTIRIKK